MTGFFVFAGHSEFQMFKERQSSLPSAAA